MPPSEPSRIFISYAHKDGAALAQRLQADLAKEGFDTWLDVKRLSGCAVWSFEIERELDTRQVTIALLTRGSYESEICRAEQLRALDKGSRVIPVLATKGADRPLYLYARQYRDFTDGANYAARLAELLADIHSDATATLPETYRKPRIAYLTAPPRVANYLERPKALHALRDALFAEDQRQPIALTALAGMGGIGKTVLAKALTDDEVVRRAFPDGIVWITAGKERKRDFIVEMREVAKALDDDLSRFDTDLACQHQYRTTIANKAALIVVDDVWTKADIEPLLAESPRSRFLFTTRDASIARFVGAREHRADLLDISQSRTLLAAWANLPVAKLPAEAQAIIQECGRLPLALSMLGAMLRDAEPEVWNDTRDLLRKADLSAIQDRLPEGQLSFFRAVEVSFQSLKPAIQDKYKALAVLLEDMAAPLPILQTLWNASAAEARFLSKHLVDRSLAQSDYTGKSFRLHDLQLDYVRAQYPDKEALELIHGAIRLSAHVIGKDPGQFCSQMVGRLLTHRHVSAIERFSDNVVEGTRTPWLRSLEPALHPPGTGLIRTLAGHKGPVNGVALIGDGRLAVSASHDDTMSLWDVWTGREVRVFTGHSGPVRAVTVTPDGRRAISGSMDKTLKVWDLASGRVLRTLRGHSKTVKAVAVTANGQRAVSASFDKTLKVWDLASGRVLDTLTGHADAIFGLAVTPDGQCAVSACADGTLKVWDLASGRELYTFTGHGIHVEAVAVTPDGQCVISASMDGTVKMWDLRSGRELRVFVKGAIGVRALAVTSDGQRVILAGHNNRLEVWELARGRLVCKLTGHAGTVSAVAVTPDGRHVVSASQDATLKVWDLYSTRARCAFTENSNGIGAVVVTPDGQRAISGSDEEVLTVWDLQSRREQSAFTGDDLIRINAVAVTSDGQRVLTGSSDGTLKVWELASGRILRTLAAHSDWVSAVAVTQDGHRAVSASFDKTLKVWDVYSGRRLQTLRGHSDQVSGVALSVDGHLAVSASYDGTLKVWDLRSGREARTLSGHSNFVCAVAVTPDGRRVVSASQDETLKVWDLASGREMRALTGHSHGVRAVQVTPDGQRAVSASWDNTVRLWNLETGEVLATFTCDCAVLSCAFSNALKMIIAGDAGGHLHFLRVEEPKSK